MLTIDGKNYIKIKDKLVECDEKGVIKCNAEETPNANGGKDVTINVKCLQIGSKIQGEKHGKRNL